jgi:predicted RNA-binding protein
MQRTYRDEIERYEEERKMPYVTTIERMGIEQDQQQASLEITLSLLRQKFGALDKKTEARLRKLTYEQLRQLTDRLLQFGSLKELRAWLQTLS